MDELTAGPSGAKTKWLAVQLKLQSWKFQTVKYFLIHFYTSINYTLHINLHANLVIFASTDSENIS